MINRTKEKTLKRERRHSRIRARVRGTSERPRLAVFKSNKYVHVQLIDDQSGASLAGLTSKGVAGKTPLERSYEVGKKIAELGKKKGVKKVVFDRGGFNFTGQVKEVARGAREAGLDF